MKKRTLFSFRGFSLLSLGVGFLFCVGGGVSFWKSGFWEEEEREEKRLREEIQKKLEEREPSEVLQRMDLLQAFGGDTQTKIWWKKALAKLRREENARRFLLELTSEPSGAKVRIGGLVQGKTPFSYVYCGKEPLEIKLKKDGYDEETWQWKPSGGEKEQKHVELSPEAP